MSLIFDEVRHTYTLDGVELPSATQLVSTLKPHFDAPSVAARVAMREGRDAATILAEWDAKRQRACDLGHLVHGCIEAQMRGTPTTGGPAEYRAWLQWWQQRGERTMEPVHIERRMASAAMRCAGTVDAIFKSAKTLDHHVFDWKTNGTFRERNQYRENLLKPFDDVPNCELGIYSIQLSIYRLMIEAEEGPCGDSWILHLTPSGAKPYKCWDFTRRVRDWLRDR